MAEIERQYAMSSSSSKVTMRAIVVALAIMELATLRSTLAGPNADATLYLYSDPSVSYTTDSTSYCSSIPLSCDEGNTCSDLGTGYTLLHLGLAFPTGASPRVAGTTFGIEYDAALSIEDWDMCSDLALTTGDWPESGSGIALTWSSPKESNPVLVGWVAAYAYGYGPGGAQMAVAGHPNQPSGVADDASPPVVDEFRSFGTFGFGQNGTLLCPDNSCQVVRSCLEFAGAPGNRFEFRGGSVTCYVRTMNDELSFDVISTQNNPDNLNLRLVVRTVGNDTLCSIPELDFDATTVYRVGPIDLSEDRLVLVDAIPDTTGADTNDSFTLAPPKHGPNAVDEWLANDTPVASDGVFTFHVPLTANELHFTGPSQGTQVFLRGPNGEIPLNGVFVDSNDEPNSYTFTSTDVIGGAWQLEMWGITENVSVSFENSAGEVWEPDFAFNPTLEESPGLDLHPSSQIWPSSVQSIDGYDWLLLGVHTADTLATVSPPACCDFGPDASRLVWHGRHDFVFASTDTLDKQVAIRHIKPDCEADSSSMLIAVGHADDPTFYTILGNSVLTLDVPSDSELLVSVRSAVRYDIATTAEVAVAGPTPAVSVIGCTTNESPYTETPDPVTLFVFAAQGAERIVLDASSTRTCRPDGSFQECGTNETYLLYPEATVTLIRPDGDSTSVIIDPTSSVMGLGRLDEPTSGFDGQVWKVRVSVSEGFSGNVVDIGFREGAMPYISWSRESLAVPLVEVWGHEYARVAQGTGTVAFEWDTSLRTEQYFQAVGMETGGVTVWDTFAAADPITNVSHSGSRATKVASRVHMRPLLSADTLESRLQPLYVVDKPLGIGPGGGIRPTNGGVEGDERLYSLLFDPLPTCTSVPECMSELDSLRNKGFQVIQNFTIPGLSATLDSVVAHGLLVEPIFAGANMQEYDEVPDYDTYQDIAEDFASYDGVIVGYLPDEPLDEKWLDRDRLLEAAYTIRAADGRWPIGVHDEPTLYNIGMLESVADVWSDDHYYRGTHQHTHEHREGTLCGIIESIELMRRNLTAR